MYRGRQFKTLRSLLWNSISRQCFNDCLSAQSWITTYCDGHRAPLIFATLDDKVCATMADMGGYRNWQQLESNGLCTVSKQPFVQRRGGRPEWVELSRSWR